VLLFTKKYLKRINTLKPKKGEKETRNYQEEKKKKKNYKMKLKKH